MAFILHSLVLASSGFHACQTVFTIVVCLLTKHTAFRGMHFTIVNSEMHSLHVPDIVRLLWSAVNAAHGL